MHSAKEYFLAGGLPTADVARLSSRPFAVNLRDTRISGEELRSKAIAQEAQRFWSHTSLWPKAEDFSALKSRTLSHLDYKTIS